MAEGITLAELGEQELLHRLSRFAPPGQWNDDAALLPNSASDQWVISSDALVEGVHFSEATTPPRSIGWRAAAANLSDLAAMGCCSGFGLTVALAAPPSTAYSWVEEVYEGMAAALAKHGGLLLGGDCTRAPLRMLAITAVGSVDPSRTLRRGAGQAGDRLVVSGAHGWSRLGLAVLAGEQLPPGIDNQQRALAVERHRHPQPRFDAVAALRASQPPDQAWRVAGTDSSDGLLRSLELLGDSSGLQPQLERDCLPLPEGCPTDPAVQSACLEGGEDFELVLALNPGWAEAFINLLPGSRSIGWLGNSAGRPCWADTGEPLPSGRGFEHFQRA